MSNGYNRSHKLDNFQFTGLDNDSVLEEDETDEGQPMSADEDTESTEPNISGLIINVQSRRAKYIEQNSSNLIESGPTANLNINETSQATVLGGFYIEQNSSNLIESGPTANLNINETSQATVLGGFNDENPPQPTRKLHVRLDLVTCSGLKLPDHTDEAVRAYMTASIGGTGPSSNHVIRLWEPFPLDIDMDKKLQERHCSLGDVGMFTSGGGFEVMFNIFLSLEENNIMNYHPPSTFKPFPLRRRVGDRGFKLHDQTKYATSNFQATYSQEKGLKRPSSYFINSTSKPTAPGGAILILPDGCTKHSLHKHLETDIANYMEDHVASWYKLEFKPSDKWRGRPNGSLMLILSCFRSHVWAGASLCPKDYLADGCKAVLRDQVEPDWYLWDKEKSPSIKTNNNSYSEVGGVVRSVAIEVASIVYGYDNNGAFETGSYQSPSRLSFRKKMSRSISFKLSQLGLSKTSSVA
ncbi:hypothetical protein JR316_0004034 [Psilocybe cubensis]|uniref:Uncharacterized protein n=2 Tax=Psilocybe cubensis TaxID=181762 RepID=A0A8H7Y654_PSICU|nr:hypothetical protein JR316_0004034 [Psilocybe cubensis]KAH9484552.1 hypothetical protein JR316_0004034 [Psilocybe cubensis]